MNISISTNFDNKLIDQVKDYGVTNLFGKLTHDFIGGGLETKYLDQIDKDKIEKHVKHAHKNGLTVNYTLNPPCIGNEEFTEEGKKQIKILLDWLYEIKMDSVTVSIPVIVTYIKKHYPRIKIKVSSSVCVDTVSKAKRWVELGVDCIVLDPMSVNRDFELLKAIRKAINIDLELIINNNCMYECPFLTYHQSFMGHSSRGDMKGAISEDWCYLNCSLKRVENPVNYIISDVIRPEDLKIYEDLGYNNFKIIDRATPQDVMIKRVKAYYNRYYDGNLLDIIQHYGYRDVVSPNEFLNNIYIDNRKLDNYLNKFINKKCLRVSCGDECKYCNQYANKAISIKDGFKEHYKNLVGKLI